MIGFAFLGTLEVLWRTHTVIYKSIELDIMRQMVYSVSMTKKRYFHEVIEEEEKILAIGLKQSRLHKKERLDKEKKKVNKNDKRLYRV